MIKEAVHSSMSELSTIVGGYCATVVDSFVSVNSVLGDIIETFSNVTDGFAKEISTVEKVASAMKKLDKDVDDGYGRTRNNDFNVSDDMLNRLAAILIEILRNAPINYNTTFEVRHGDVVLDKERTGRVLAPVISRIQATT
jgi:UDP-2,3-diacylglucosamine pyrophosphatase LpxH